MRLNDPKGDQFRGLKRFPRNLAAGSPLGYTSVSKGQTQFIGEHSLSIVGSGDVDGTLYVDGGIEGTGDIDWTGDVNVTGGGKVTVGTAMTLDPSVSSGAVVFSNGAQVFTDASTVQVYLGNGVVQISNTEARLQLGGVSVSLTSSGVTMNSLPTKTGTGLLVGLLWRDPSTGLIHRITS